MPYGDNDVPAPKHSHHEHRHDHPPGPEQVPHDHPHIDGHADSHAGEEAHGHDHPHHHGSGSLGWLRELLPFGHGHSHGEAKVDNALETSAQGLWALKVSLVGLGVTAAFQLIIALLSGSASLLADTIHNFADALTALPLGIAFILGRRPPNRRYTYGYGRAEDVAGVLIVGMILASALVAGYEAYRKFANPQPLNHVGWVIAAALVGFLGNEGVGIFRIRVGRAIGSAALIADGDHARVDGITSLTVLFGAAGSYLGYPLVDPIVGMLITIAILFIVKDTAVMMWHRLMDAVEPETVDKLERTAAAVPGAQQVHDVRVRWLGHRLQAELHVTVDEDLPTRDSHRLLEEVRHALFHAEPRLSVVNVHADPCGHGGEDPHSVTAHHAAEPLQERAGRAHS